MTVNGCTYENFQSHEKSEHSERTLNVKFIALDVHVSSIGLQAPPQMMLRCTLIEKERNGLAVRSPVSKKPRISASENFLPTARDIERLCPPTCARKEHRQPRTITHAREATAEQKQQQPQQQHTQQSKKSSAMTAAATLMPMMAVRLRPVCLLSESTCELACSVSGCRAATRRASEYAAESGSECDTAACGASGAADADSTVATSSRAKAARLAFMTTGVMDGDGGGRGRRWERGRCVGRQKGGDM
eukprot:IDg7488t1